MKKIIFALIFLLSINTMALTSGLHLFKVQFGNGPTFNDLVVVEQDLKGSFTVPGVFTYPIEVKKLDNGFSFILKGSEGGQTFLFHFTAKIIGEKFVGNITDLDKIIGTFEGEKIYDL